jgi:peptidoglycan hydrolase CwlO-like protein
MQRETSKDAREAQKDAQEDVREAAKDARETEREAAKEARKANAKRVKMAQLNETIGPILQQLNHNDRQELLPRLRSVYVAVSTDRRNTLSF